ncbi:MAG: FAD-binding protein [Candidatus Bathyarchaeia archaeon]
MYPKGMMESLKKLEESRYERMEEKIPLFEYDEKAKLLQRFHPDYRAGTTRALRVGPNKGIRTPHEFANILEAYSVLDPEGFDLSKIDYDVDVLVVGGGGAGSSAALVAQEAGADVLLATKLRLGDANTMMAQMGIQAADKPTDSPAIHYLDVVGGGGFHNIPELVRALVVDAPSVIDWLEDLGVMFDKLEDGTMFTLHGGGTSRKRIHTSGDYTGAQIMRTIRDEVWNQGIEILEFSPACELLTDDEERCAGAVLYNMETGEYTVVRAKTTILATGGSGRLHIQGFPTTNHYGATGDGVVLAYRAGGKIIFMDTIQYHPTGSAYPEQIFGLLVTAKFRGMGAQLVNREGKRFVYELETRDAVASAIIRECTEREMGVETPTGKVGVWLDSPLIEVIHGPGTVEKSFPALHRQYTRFGIDISKEPMLIYPTQHYQNGGVLIDPRGETTVPNLYAAGEVSGGVHGRNRLAGNSLLEILVFGRRAGRSAAERSRETRPGKLTLDHIRRYHMELEDAGIAPERTSPILLPDYRREEVKERVLEVF